MLNRYVVAVLMIFLGSFISHAHAAGIAPAVNSALGCTNTGDIYQYNGTGMGCATGVVNDGSIASLSTGKSSVSGLINVLSYACGITIGDGSTHTVGTAPAGSCFNGITTLAGLAAITIDGTTPFSFLTDSGTITGPQGTSGSTTNPFTSSGGSYVLTNAKVTNIDIAWLAIQATYLTGRSYTPAGTYIVGSAIPLPLMIPLSFDGGGNIQGTPTHIVGDGPMISNVKAGSDFGAGVPLVSCGDPSATVGNALGRFNGNTSDCAGVSANLLFEGPGANWYWAAGTTTYQMDGFAPGSHQRTADIESNGFNHDWLIDGDHTMYIRAHAVGGAHGFYWDGPNPVLSGDLAFFDLQSSGESIDAIDVGANAGVTADFSGETYLSAPVAIRGESSSGCTAMLYDAHFSHLMTEFIGNEVIADDTGYNPSTFVYTDANKCRNIDKFLVDNWYWSFSNSSYIANRQRRAVIDVADIGGVINGLQADSGAQSPTLAVPGGDTSTPVAVFNVKTVENAITGLKISGNINNLITQIGTLPLFPANLSVTGFVTLENPGVWTGSIAQLYTAGNYTTSTIGDLLEPTNYQGAYPEGYNSGGTQPVLGVVMQTGLTANGFGTGAFVPYANGGTVPVNIGWVPNSPVYTKGTGIGAAVKLTAGSGYSNGTYTWTATAGCTTEPAGTVTVAGGSLSAFTITNEGVGCTTVPTVAVPGGAGAGTGGLIAPVWPGALPLKTTTLAAPVIGALVNGYSAGTAAGQISLRLLGMQ